MAEVAALPAPQPPEGLLDAMLAHVRQHTLLAPKKPHKKQGVRRRAWVSAAACFAAACLLIPMVAPHFPATHPADTADFFTTGASPAWGVSMNTAGGQHTPYVGYLLPDVEHRALPIATDDVIPQAAPALEMWGEAPIMFGDVGTPRWEMRSYNIWHWDVYVRLPQILPEVFMAQDGFIWAELSEDAGVRYALIQFNTPEDPSLHPLLLAFQDQQQVWRSRARLFPQYVFDGQHPGHPITFHMEEVPPLLDRVQHALRRSLGGWSDMLTHFLVAAVWLAVPLVMLLLPAGIIYWEVRRIKKRSRTHNKEEIK